MRILLIQLRQIGDVITTTPAIRATRKTWPNATIDFLTEPPSDQVVEFNNCIDNVITIKRGASVSEFLEVVKKIRANKYDVVVDFFCNPTSAYLTFLSGCKIRLGYNNRFRKHFYTHKVDKSLAPMNCYAAVHKLMLLAHIGVLSDGLNSEYPLSTQAQEKADNVLRSLGWNDGDLLVSMGVASRDKHRIWPQDKFAAVADYLIESYGAKIIFIYGPGEEEYPKIVQKHMKHKALGLYEQGGLHLLRGIAERSSLNISCDTGTAHLVKSAGIYGITIFAARTNPLDWTIPNDPMSIAIQTYAHCSGNCLYDNCLDPFCITSVSEDVVIGHCDQVMANLDHKKLK